MCLGHLFGDVLAEVGKGCLFGFHQAYENCIELVTHRCDSSSYGTSQAAFQPVPPGNAAEPFWRRKPDQSGAGVANDPTKMAVASSAVRHDEFKSSFGKPALQNEPLQFLVGQAMPPTESTSLEHVAAIGRLHSDSKSVRLLLVAVIGLKRALHRSGIPWL